MSFHNFNHSNSNEVDTVQAIKERRFLAVISLSGLPVYYEGRMTGNQTQNTNCSNQQ